MEMNATLIGQFITFMLFVWFTMKYVWPPITKAMQERAQKIASGLEAAERGRYELEVAENKSRVIIKEAKKQAANIIEQAHLHGASVIDDAKEKAQEENKRIVAMAQEEIQREIIQTKIVLRERLAELVAAGVTKVIQTQLKLDMNLHRDLLQKLASEI